MYTSNSLEFTSTYVRFHFVFDLIPRRSRFNLSSVSSRRNFKFTSTSLRVPFGFTSVSRRFHFKFTSSSLRSRFDFALSSLACHFDSTSISLWFPIDFTSISHRCYFELTSSSLRVHFDLTSISHRFHVVFLSERISTSLRFRIIPQNEVQLRGKGKPSDYKTLRLTTKGIRWCGSTEHRASIARTHVRNETIFGLGVSSSSYW